MAIVANKAAYGRLDPHLVNPLTVLTNVAFRGSKKVAFIGDSITAQGFGGTEGGGFIYSTVGYATWLPFLTRRKIDIIPGSNFGVSGETTANIRDRINAVLTFDPDLAIVLAGTNDIGTLTAAQSISNLDTIYNALTGNRILIIAVLITPRGSITTAQQGKIQQINDYIRQQAITRSNFYVVDPALAYGDVTTGAPKTTMSGDSLHPNVYGAYAIAKEIASVIDAIYPANSLIPFNNPLDIYSATDNPRGNLLGTAGLTIGTGGSFSNGPTGSLATGWTANGVNMPAGSTTVGAKVAKSDGREFQQLTFGGTYNVASPGNFNVTSANVAANCAAGDKLEAICELEADAGIVNLATCQLLLNIATPSGNPIPTDFAGNNTHIMPPVAFSGILKTPQVILPATPTTVQAILRFAATGVGGSSSLAGVVRFGSVSIRKVL